MNSSTAVSVGARVTTRGFTPSNHERRQRLRSRKASTTTTTTTTTTRAVAAGGATSARDGSKTAGKSVEHFFRRPFLSEDAANTLVRKVNAKLGRDVLKRVETEQCFNVEHVGALDAAARETLTWLLRETYEPELFGEKSALNAEAGAPTVEVGPRLAFQSAWSTNAVSICQSCGLANVT